MILSQMHAAARTPPLCDFLGVLKRRAKIAGLLHPRASAAGIINLLARPLRPPVKIPSLLPLRLPKESVRTKNGPRDPRERRRELNLLARATALVKTAAHDYSCTNRAGELEPARLSGACGGNFYEFPEPGFTGVTPGSVNR